MSEARANANQGGGNINGGAGAPVHVGSAQAAAPPVSSVSSTVDASGPELDFPQIVPGQNMKVPESEAAAEAMMRAQFRDDPELMRRAGQEFMERMNRLAEQAAAEKGEAQKIAPAPAATPIAPIAPTVEAEPRVVAETPAHAEVRSDPSPSPAPAPRPAAAPSQAASAVPWPPPGYLPVPEGLFVWTPEAWGGRPLHCVPDRAIERDRQATILIVILMAPAYARNRAGRVVSLPEGARVAVHAGVAWGPVMPLARGPEGRPVICARPSLDAHGRPIVYDLGDGAREWGLEITFDPDPKNPGFPRLIDLETVKGARSEAGE